MKQPIYAKIKLKADPVYKAGEVSLWRRNLMMCKGRNEKIIKLMSYEI